MFNFFPFHRVIVRMSPYGHSAQIVWFIWFSSIIHLFTINVCLLNVLTIIFWYCAVIHSEKSCKTVSFVTLANVFVFICLLWVLLDAKGVITTPFRLFIQILVWKTEGKTQISIRLTDLIVFLSSTLRSLQ